MINKDLEHITVILENRKVAYHKELELSLSNWFYLFNCYVTQHFVR